MRYGVILSVVMGFLCSTAMAEPFGLYVKQVPTKNLLTENAYEGFDYAFNMRRDSEMRSGNSGIDGLHINIIKFPHTIFNSSEFKTLKNATASTLTGKMMERVYEQKLRRVLKTYKHQHPIYILGHEALNNQFLRVSSYMGQAEIYNLNSHYILFLTEKPIRDSQQIVSLPLKKIVMSLHDSESIEDMPLESIEKRLTNISEISLKKVDETLKADLLSELKGPLPKSVSMDIEFSTMPDSEDAREYFTVEKTIHFAKSCRFLF